MNDKRIIELFFARDEEAIKETEKKYGKLCRYIAQNYLASREDAEECVNDTWLALWNSIPPDRPNDLRAYSVTILRRRAIDRTRSVNAWKRSGNMQTVGEEFLTTLDDGSDLAADYENSRAVGLLNELHILKEEQLGKMELAKEAIYLERVLCNESGGVQDQIAAAFGGFNRINFNSLIIWIISNN